MMYSIPAVITAYDKGNQRATVQPTLIPKMVDGVHVPYPAIEDVPVEMPCTNNCAILLPVKVGDSVTLDIMDHSIDEWARYENSITMIETDSLRKNQLSDAVARVGLKTFNDCYGTTDDLIILMKHEGDTEAQSRITLTSKGNIELETPSVKLKLDETAKTLEAEALKVVMKTPLLDVVGAIHATGVISSDADVLAGSKSLLTHD